MVENLAFFENYSEFRLHMESSGSSSASKHESVEDKLVATAESDELNHIEINRVHRIKVLSQDDDTSSSLSHRSSLAEEDNNVLEDLESLHIEHDEIHIVPTRTQTEPNSFDPNNKAHRRQLSQAGLWEYQVYHQLAAYNLPLENKAQIYQNHMQALEQRGLIEEGVLAFAAPQHATNRRKSNLLLTNLLETTSQNVLGLNRISEDDVSGLQLEPIHNFVQQTPRLTLPEFPGALNTQLEILSLPTLHLSPTISGPRWSQIECLGKGGFGSVWACQNSVDGEIYAIKRIVVSHKEVQEKGFAEFYKEVKILAMLDHPNIVRYYGSWLESFTASQFKKLKVNYYAVDDGYYEDSGSTNESITHDSGHSESAGSGSALKPSLFSESIVTDSASIRSAGAKDEDESKSEALELSDFNALITSDSKSVQSVTEDGPVHVISIQMAKYTLALSDLIGTPSQQQVREVKLDFDYNFHPRVALELLLKILEGLENMHHYHLVHRDLKPANIFLKLQTGAIGENHSSVRVAGCKCSLEGHSCELKSDCLDGPLTWVTPKIGDFGLTAEIKRNVGDNDELLQKSPNIAGTLLYMPPKWCEDNQYTRGKQIPHMHSPDLMMLDIYAMGIILFELLACFHTAMERHDSIQKLRSQDRSHASFPSDFCRAHTSKIAVETIGKLRSLILKMTAEVRSRWSLADVKKSLIQLLADLR